MCAFMLSLASECAGLMCVQGAQCMHRCDERRSSRICGVCVHQARAQWTVPKEGHSRGELESLEAAHPEFHVKSNARKIPKIAQQGRGGPGSTSNNGPALRASDATSANQATAPAHGANPAANGPAPMELEHMPVAAKADQVRLLS